MAREEDFGLHRRRSRSGAVVGRLEFGFVSGTCVGVARLNHEVADDTVERHACVHPIFDILHEIVPVPRCVVVQLQPNLSGSGL